MELKFPEKLSWWVVAAAGLFGVITPPAVIVTLPLMISVRAVVLVPKVSDAAWDVASTVKLPKVRPGDTFRTTL